jgi:hypothetical protein
MFTPFLIAPGIAAAAVTMFLADPRIKPIAAVSISLTAVLGPWILEVAGVLPQTMSSRAGDLVLHSPALTVAMPATGVVLATYATLLIALTGVVAKQLGQSMRKSLLTVELQAWHLRKLVGS